MCRTRPVFFFKSFPVSLACYNVLDTCVNIRTSVTVLLLFDRNTVNLWTVDKFLKRSAKQPIASETTGKAKYQTKYDNSYLAFGFIDNNGKPQCYLFAKFG